MESEHTNQLDADHSFACMLLRRLASKYHSVSFLTGGLVTFRQTYPHLCQQANSSSGSSSSATHGTLANPHSHIVPLVVVHANQPNSGKSTSPIEEEVNELTKATNSSQLVVKPSWLNIRQKQTRFFSHSLSTFGLNSSSFATPSSEEAHQQNMSSSSSSTMSSASSSLASTSLGSFNFSTSAMQGAVAGSSDDENKTVPNKGPTEILGFLYLGSQEDSLCEKTLKELNITNILNVSATCPKPEFIDDAHFLRISINDGHGEKILPYFDVAYRFIEKCRKAKTKVLIHCLAGISRSPTLAIAYLMKHLGLKPDDAYKFVKERRKTISPNFNFLGQLYEYEKHLLNSSGNTSSSTDTICTEQNQSGSNTNSSTNSNSSSPIQSTASITSTSDFMATHSKKETNTSKSFTENQACSSSPPLTESPLFSQNIVSFLLFFQ